MSSTIKSEYKVFENTSPYTKNNRYDAPKEIFKGILSKLKKIKGENKDFSAVDIGCANGEFLYFLKQSYTNSKLNGYDATESFINSGKSFKGLNGVNLQTKNLFDIKNEQYDVTFCLGTFQIFHDIEKPLSKLLEITKKGGLIFIESLFNKHDIDVRLEFSDNTKEEMQGVWRSDFNQHSYYAIDKFLKDKVKSFEFDELPMETEISYDSKTPSTFAFTFKNKKGKNIITNGLNLILNSTLLTIQK